MKAFIALLLVVVAAVLAYITLNNPTAVKYEPSYSPVAEKARPSIVAIEVNKRPSGFGSVISENGFVISTKHSFNAALDDRVSIVTFDKKRYEARLVGQNLRNDYVLLQADTKGRVPALPIYSGQDLSGLSDVLVLRLNSDSFLTENPSRLTHKRYSEPGCRRSPGDNCINKTIEYKGRVGFSGFSGGPVITPQGEFIGLHTSQHRDNDKMGFGWPIEEVLNRFPQAQL